MHVSCETLCWLRLVISGVDFANGSESPGAITPSWGQLQSTLSYISLTFAVQSIYMLKHNNNPIHKQRTDKLLQLTYYDYQRLISMNVPMTTYLTPRALWNVRTNRCKLTTESVCMLNCSYILRSQNIYPLMPSRINWSDVPRTGIAGASRIQYKNYTSHAPWFRNKSHSQRGSENLNRV